MVAGAKGFIQSKRPIRCCPFPLQPASRLQAGLARPIICHRHGMRICTPGQGAEATNDEARLRHVTAASAHYVVHENSRQDGLHHRVVRVGPKRVARICSVFRVREHLPERNNLASDPGVWDRHLPGRCTGETPRKSTNRV